MRRRLAVLVRCLALTMIGAQAFADPTLRHFDIQTQATASALNEFARQADITLVFASALVDKHRMVGIKGDFTVLDALRKLLDGTGLSFTQVSATTIAIGAETKAAEPQHPPASGPGVVPDPTGNGNQTKGDDNMNHRGLFTRIAALFALSGAVLAGGHAYGQDTAATPAAAVDASAANTSTLDEIVVTGTAEAKGIRKLDASFSITTASLEEIRDVNPSSSADLLKIVPGIWAESSGGESGANIELAGFPGSGDAPYVTYQLNGSPVFPVPTLSFMENSSLFRLDESIERAEVLQGGPGVVFSNGQMGATANFILRQGTATPRGDLGITWGDEGMYRIDGFYGGPLAPDWYMSVGGFYRYSSGVRGSQFPADDGGQITATVTHTLENGTIMFFARELNDKNLFITDIPVTVSGTGNSQSVSGFPGFNPNTGTFAGSGLRGISVQETPNGPPVTADLANGRGADLHTFGNDLDVQIVDGISLSNKLMYSAGDVNCYCLFNNFAPQTLSSFLNDPKTGVITTTNANPAITGPYGLATSGTATLVSSGAAVNPNSYVASLGFWIVQKQIQSFTDDLRFTFDVVPGNKLTVGAYLAAYKSDDHWWLGNNELITATPNAQLIDLTLNNGVNVTNPAGQLGATFFALNEHWTGLNTALFLSDQWKFDQWLFDAGYRVEEQRDHGTIENDTATDLDSDPRHLYNKGVSVPNGTFNQGVSCDTSGTGECTEFRHTRGTWTLGANYEITPHMATYARINQGVHFPGFDDLRSGQPQVQSIKNYEVGYRVQTETFYGVIDGSRKIFSGVPFQQFTGGGQQITAVYGAQSWVANVEARWEPIRHLTFDVSGDWARALYAHNPAFDGLTLARQPRLQFRLTPAYELPMDFGSVRFFMTYTHVGLRYGDPTNQQVLPSFYTLDAGIVSELGDHFEVRLQGSNLSNQLGLTEGNARIAVGSGSGIANNFEMARPIFGREINVQLRYKF